MFASLRSIANVKIAKRVCPTEFYRFERATQKDKTAIMNLLGTKFIHEEPHTKALKMTAEEVNPLFEWIIGKCLECPFSFKVIEKSSSKLVGFRTMSIGHRDKSKETPFEIDEKQMTKNMMLLGGILDASKKKFWKEVGNDVNTVLRREISFVLPEYQRQGIANYLVTVGNDPETLKNINCSLRDKSIIYLWAIGLDGIVSEATSLANQNLLAKHGFECIVQPDYNLELHDGSDGTKVMFKDFRKL